jgi:AhpD family alkylhydroperoxidase
MSLVSMLSAEEAPITVKHFFSNGDPGPLVSTFAHVPELLQSVLPFIGNALGPSSIDFRTKEIVILRASALQECNYCVNTHTVVANKAGLNREELLALRGEGSLSVFDSEKEQVLLRWTDVIALGPQPIEQKLKEKMTVHFDESEIVELTLTIGATVMLNRYATALDLPVSKSHQEFLSKEGLVY